MARENGVRLALIGATIVVFVGCGASVSTAPPAGTNPVPTATIEPVVSPTPIPTPTEPAPLYEFTYNGEPGGHGGPPLLDLEAPVVVDYTVTRGCAFTLKVTFGVPDNGIEAARFQISAGTPTVSGTWPLEINPGSYYIVGSETVGCPFHIAAKAVPAEPLPVASPDRSSTLYYEVMKNELIMGGHGGTPMIGMPADLQIDYRVTGTCHFEMSFGTAEGTSDLPKLSLDVAHSEMTGTWLVTIPAGSVLYYADLLPAMGVPTGGFFGDMPLIIAFVILAAFTYSSGLRAPWTVL